ncbi:conserved hypothetical protein [Ferroglobus placidus DSM 10642]|uniref:Uncharacterized protein n=1 Tax=Ferroglobus placidus (strain DSM 10642 / AEDII12DO) TaxID=589924 RepID=D3S0C5_FERPA|nr:hypothetical protein [Ferroglobus placidus]ADC66188.1 conserved hypothetical protein [Ferroglobus placidus DSM 10642]
MDLREAVMLALKDIEMLAPKLLGAIVIICVFFVFAVILNRALTRIFSTLDVEKIFEPLVRTLGVSISFTSIILWIVNMAVALTAFYSIVGLLFPEFIDTANSILDYFSRVLSVLLLIVFVFIAITRLIERFAIEEKMKNFLTLIILLISMVLLIDVTNLSAEVKSALAEGISIGVGLSIAVFAAWYLFGEKLG